MKSTNGFSSALIRYSIIGLCTSGLLATQGCKSDPAVGGDSAASSAPTSGSGGGGSTPTAPTVGNAGNFSVSVAGPKSTVGQAFQYYLHDQNALFTAKSCAVAPGTATPNNDIYCILDMNELDLYFNGANLQYNAPPGMCAYTRVMGYSYFRAQPGTIPAGSSCTLTINKTTGVNSLNCGAAPLHLNGTSVVCNYDYGAYKGPNCCEGKFSLTTTTTDATGTSSVTSSVDYGGQIASCYAGSAIKDGNLNSVGDPLSMYYATSNSGINYIMSAYPLIGPQGFGLTQAANYWNPADFKRTATVETGSFPPAAAGDWPHPFDEVDSLPDAVGNIALHKPHPYYEVGCLDAGEEYVARIRIMIRAWDTVANFTATSNPYTNPVTLEPGYNGDYYLHDRSVWKDFSVAAGKDIFPGFNQ